MYLLVYALRALRYLIYSVVHLLAGGLRYTRYALLDSDKVLEEEPKAQKRHSEIPALSYEVRQDIEEQHG